MSGLVSSTERYFRSVTCLLFCVLLRSDCAHAHSITAISMLYSLQPPPVCTCAVFLELRQTLSTVWLQTLPDLWSYLLINCLLNLDKPIMKQKPWRLTDRHCSRYWWWKCIVKFPLAPWVRYWGESRSRDPSSMLASPGLPAPPHPPCAWGAHPTIHV